MQIQVNCDNHVEGGDELTRQVEGRVVATFGRFGDQITRVEVHLSDVNGPKSAGDDKRCLMEARLSGLQPIVASHQAPTLEEAIDGAAERLARSLDRNLGRIDDRKGRIPHDGDQTI